MVANKFQNAIGELSRKDFESSIERNIDIIIPFDPKMVSQAAKLGKSYAEICKGTKAGQVWTNLMRLVLDGADVDAEDAPWRRKGKIRAVAAWKTGRHRRSDGEKGRKIRARRWPE